MRLKNIEGLWVIIVTYPGGGGRACCVFVIVQVFWSPLAIVPVAVNKLD
jgi:hypothetical protein